MGADLYIDKLYNNGLAERERAFSAARAARDKAKAEGRPAAEIEMLQHAVEAAHGAIYNNPGYFRDSYNGTSVAWLMGLSWWRDVIPMLNKEGQLTPGKAKLLLERVRAAEVRFRTEEELKADHCAVDDGDNSPESWHKAKLEHKAELVAFLERAIELNEPIACSL